MTKKKESEISIGMFVYVMLNICLLITFLAFTYRLSLGLLAVIGAIAVYLFAMALLQIFLFHIFPIIIYKICERGKKLVK